MGWQSGQVIARSDAAQLDRDDPLAHWRDEFVIPDDELVYLDGNSLGRTPKRTVDALRRVVEERTAARAAKDWARADELRDAIEEAGYLVEDTAEGSVARKAKDQVPE